jgi:hypothetical protein
MMLIPCIICGDEWDISWAREWENASGQWIGVPTAEFVCLTCKGGVK